MTMQCKQAGGKTSTPRKWVKWVENRQHEAMHHKDYKKESIIWTASNSINWKKKAAAAAKKKKKKKKFRNQNQMKVKYEQNDGDEV